MNRRTFLSWLGGTAAGAAAAHTLDLDKLLWVHGAKRIFIPPPVAVRAFDVNDVRFFNIGDLFSIGSMGVSKSAAMDGPFVVTGVASGSIKARIWTKRDSARLANASKRPNAHILARRD